MGEGVLEPWSRKRPLTIFRKVLNSGTKPNYCWQPKKSEPLELCCNWGNKGHIREGWLVTLEG